ncbi:hypothetical protein V8F20_012375 [Naviculisporaceae sp. PSN 640]
MESRPPQGSSSQPSLANPSRVRFAEEDPGLEAVHPTPVHKIREEIPPGVVVDSSSAPEVYWADDRENDANLSQYTFYREPTPPPYDERHKKEYGYSASVTGGRASRMEDGQGGFTPNGQRPGEDDWSSTSSAGVVCGIRRRAFWVIIAMIILFFIALALGVGLGVGLTKGNAPPSPTTTSSSSPANAPPPDSGKDSSPSPSEPTASAPVPSGTGTPKILPKCPAANNTLYTTTTTSNTKKTFLRVCGVDYSGVGGATDLRNVRTETMAECMDACAELSGCTGCGWGQIPGDTTSKHRCWLKTDLQTPHNATTDWDFAILQLQTTQP